MLYFAQLLIFELKVTIHVPATLQYSQERMPVAAAEESPLVDAFTTLVLAASAIVTEKIVMIELKRRCILKTAKVWLDWILG
jgi:hypothetical protein